MSTKATEPKPEPQPQPQEPPQQQQQQQNPPHHAILDFVKEQMATKGTPAQPKAKATEKPPARPSEQPKAKENAPKEDAQKDVSPKEADPKADGAEVELSEFAKAAIGEEKKTDESKEKEEKGEKQDETQEDDVDKLKLPDTASVAAKDAFKKVNGDRARMKKEIEALKAEKEELAKKISQAESDENTKKVADLEKELAAMRAKGEDAEKKLYALDVKQSEKWKQLISEPLQTLGTKVEDIAKGYGIDSKQLRQALAGADTKALSELLSDVNEFDKVELAKIRTEVQDILKLRSNLEADSKEAHRILQEAASKEQEAITGQRKMRFESTRNETANNLRQLIPFAFKELDGDNEWNGLIKNFNEFVEKADPSQFTSEQMGQTVALAASVPVLGATINRLREELVSISEKYQRLTKTKPAAGPKAGAVSEASNNGVHGEGIQGFVKEQLKLRGR